MKIYTKGGDLGETGLFGGVRVPKDDLRVRVYGTLDELNASVGVILSESGLPEEVLLSLTRVQNELFQLGAELATPRGKVVSTALIGENQVSLLETEIDSMEAKLAPLKAFILPGGSRAAALGHVARTVSRRAERELVTLHRAEPVRPLVLKYLNRLSDYFFVTARYLNHSLGVQDIPWTKI